MFWLLSFFALASVALVHATVIRDKRQDITTLNSTQIAEFAPFTHLASAAYCDPSTTRTWNCGVDCQAVPDFEVVMAGGDGSDTQFWYVGYSPSLKMVIVAHQGTDPSQLFADLTDANSILWPLDPSLFPGVPLNVEAHMGFANEQARTARAILSVVRKTLSEHSLSSVTVVGHSLGGALALLDGLYLSLHLPKSVTVKVISYGTPRIGNQAFADFVDRQLSRLVTHVNNREDPIPIVPFMHMGYHHSSGEIHIQDSGAWDACLGQDNRSKLCIVGDMENNIFEAKLAKFSNHDGPYERINIGC